ncbi:MAG: hypothetical protein EXR99_04800 [Gemmataceae bacterium]|nr:hypothetical protein [Gemmataceae bacterium]
MNDEAAVHYTEFVFRRLADPLRLFGREFSPNVWLMLLAAALLLGFLYIGWMYLKDARSIGPWWSSLLGLARALVYGVLAFAFLLPAEQTWEKSSSHSRVVAAFDVSHSMSKTVDDIPTEAVPLSKLPTRQDKVVAFLAGGKGEFLETLEKTNPLYAYRFGRLVDGEFLEIREGAAFTQDERQRLKEPLEKGKQAEKTLKLSLEEWQAWLNPDKPLAGASSLRLSEFQKSSKTRLDNGDFNGTNLVDSLAVIVQKEMNHMVQGILVFSEGRSTEGSLQALKDLEERAAAARIPLFVVGVGDDRPKIKTEIADLRVPGTVHPDDRFRVVAEVVGEGLPEKEFQTWLDVTRVRKLAGGKEEALEIALEEAGVKGAKDRARLVLGNKVSLQSPLAKFDKGNPPRAEVEFQIDAIVLAKAAGREGDLAGKKWVMSETGDSEIRFTARVAKDRAEISADKEHKRGPVEMRVLDKPLRILLLASGPTRDYQFVRTLLVREMEKKRAELAILLQNPPGKIERRIGIVQDVPPERMLTRFPDLFDSTTVDPNEKIYDLASYDVILAFDPDWKQVSEPSMGLLKTWVEKGGGLVVVAGPLHTLELARPGLEREKLKPILDLYPVVLKDIRIEEMDRKADTPWPLRFDAATPEMEFLRLDENDNIPFLKDWTDFFNVEGKDGQPPRGFYNFYPVDQARTGAQVVARFADPVAKTRDGKEQPFVVISDPSSGKRVVWVGSGETWRLRQYRESYFERFWMKLARYAAASASGGENKRISPYLGGPYLANRFIEFEARIDDRGGKPLGNTGRPPKIRVLPPAGVPESEVPREVIMTPRPASEGIFRARFLLKSPGRYEIIFEVPETGDRLSGNYLVVEQPDPERENTRPDFAFLHRLASPAEMVFPRMTDADREKVRAALVSPPPVSEGPASKPAEEQARLFFDLRNAHLIPLCMKADTKMISNRGPIRDWWDEGFTMWTGSDGKPVKMSWLLVIVVGLLSFEWLTRKLLRIA